MENEEISKYTCKRCGNSFEPWKDEYGDIEKNICQMCDMDERVHNEWERDNFGG